MEESAELTEIQPELKRIGRPFQSMSHCEPKMWYNDIRFILDTIPTGRQFSEFLDHIRNTLNIPLSQASSQYEIPVHH